MANYKKKIASKVSTETIIALGFTNPRQAGDEYFEDNPDRREVIVLAADPARGIDNVEYRMIRMDK